MTDDDDRSREIFFHHKGRKKSYMYMKKYISWETGLYTCVYRDSNGAYNDGFVMIRTHTHLRAGFIVCCIMLSTLNLI